MPSPKPKEESLIAAIKRILGMEDVRKLTEKAGKSPKQREEKGPSRPYRKSRTAMGYQKKIERLKREREKDRK